MVTVTDANALTGTTTTQAPLWTAARMGMDFNNDGNVDVAGIDANNDLRLYTGDGTGNLGGDGAMWPTGGRWAGFKPLT